MIPSGNPWNWRWFWVIGPVAVVTLLCSHVTLTTGQLVAARAKPTNLCGKGATRSADNPGLTGQAKIDRVCAYKYPEADFGACNSIETCSCQTDQHDPIRGALALPYCNFLIQDNPDSWKYPFRGRHPNPPNTWATASDRGLQNQMNYQCGSQFHYCLAFLPRLPTDTNNHDFYSQLFRFSAYDGTFIYDPYDRIAQTKRERLEGIRRDLTNRLRFTPEVVAQEGISFCIAGRHFKRSPLVEMDSLRGFQALAERSFDIGNHIDPEDPARMNRFVLDNEHKSFFQNLRPGGYDDRSRKRTPTAEQTEWNRPNARNRRGTPDWDPIAQSEYENVYAGFIKLDVINQWISDPRITILPIPPPNPNRDLPLASGFENRPAHPDHQPGPNCRNPYKVQVTTIEADGKSLHNYLHIKVFAEDVGNPTGENCPLGKMRLLMLEVRDEHGYPVGEFTDEIPCDQDEATLGAELKCPAALQCRRWTGTKDNQMPCMFSHPKSNVHPWIFLVSASDVLSSGGGGGAGGGGGGGPNVNQGQGQGQGGAQAQDFCNTRNPPPDDNDYFTEIHATWRFAQMNNGWIRELHFATMIIEDSTPIRYYTSRKVRWIGPATPSDMMCAALKNPAVLRTDGTCAVPSGHSGCCNDRCFCNEHSSDRPASVACSVFGAPCDYRDIYPDARDYFHYGSACWYWHPFWTPWSRIGIHELTLINRCVDENDNTNRPYGYSAKYTALKPTFKTMGGWDHLQKRFIPGDNINCHVDLTKGDLYDFEPGRNDRVTLRPGLKEFLQKEYILESSPRYPLPANARYAVSPMSLNPTPLYGRWSGFHWQRVWCDKEAHFIGLPEPEKYIFELPDWHTPGLSVTNSPDPLQKLLKFQYFGRSPQSAARKMFRSAHQDPIIVKAEFPDHPQMEYFGSEHLISPIGPQEAEATVLQGTFGNDEQKFSLQQQANSSRCPCPFIPTTPPPEIQTKTDVEIDGRQIHVINTLFAWMVLVPVAFFVARFYKETFSKVFFFQEFWWYTIHVLTLLTALLFMFGGIYGMKLKRDDSYKLVWTDATAVHIYTAYVLIGIYVIHLGLGAFRLYNPEWRSIQIALHWGIGWVEYSLAIVVSLSATAIPTGMMNCYAFGVYCGFILFQIAMTLGMELHMRFVVDRELQLDPPREYMPPPMMRVFHRDAPHSKCRIFALIVFVIGCFTFYGVMHLFLSLKDGEIGCFQPVAKKTMSPS